MNELLDKPKWPICRIKDIGDLKLGKMLMDKPQDGYVLKPYLKSRNIGWLNLNMESVDEMYFNKREIESLRLKSNDLLFSEGGEVGKTALWRNEISECYIQNSVHKLTVAPDCDARYYLYLSFNYAKSGYYRSIVNLVSIMHLTYEKLRDVLVYKPNKKEQTCIADYLDTKTAAIDKRIAALEKKQEVYSRLRKSIINRAVTRGLNPNVPLKESGVDWIGMIPEHWEVRRMKDISYMYSGLTGKSGDDFRCEDESKTKPFIPFTNILNNTKVNPTQVNRVVMTENEDQNMVKKEDLLFLMSSEDYESIAKSAVVEDEIGEVYLNSFCRGLRPTIDDLCSSFLNYELQSSYNRDALRFEARGFTRINIKVDRITSHVVVLPPLPEQHTIANYLDEKCAKIDAAVENINKQVDALKRLKRALINEVVTGKRRV